MSEPILKAEHLGITFGGLKAVSDFNMTINSGELVGLIGPNGAGKTTVFNLLTGVYQPTEGEFFLDGERMNGKKTYQVVRAGIARTFQNIRLFGQMTVEENVLVAFNESFSYHMGGAIFRTPKFWKQEREMHAKAIDLLKIFGLEGLAETEAANLPYGAQRKLEIARALATGMKLLLLDEPAAGMNPTETEDLLNCINTIRDRFGIAILLIEHDMSLVMNVCQRIQVLDYGRTIAAGTPEEIANNPQVISAYLGSDDDTDSDDACQVLERIGQTLSRTQVSPTVPGLRVTFSAGVTRHLADEPLARTIDRADHALYRAKASGRNRTECLSGPD